MTKRMVPILLSLGAVLLLATSGAWAAGELPTLAQKNCLNCHEGISKQSGLMAGNLSGKSLKAKTLQIKINNKQEAVRFGAETKVQNVPDLEALKSGMALRVYYKMDGATRVATRVVVKPKIKVAEKQLMKVGELAKLVALGPEKGGYTLIDSRPPGGFAKGHIPTAVSLPFPKMKGSPQLLPEDKSKLVVFYCQGFR
jgi:hypothetical protein